MSSRARLLRDGLLNAAATLAGAVVGLMLVPVMLAHLPGTDYGTWIALLALVRLAAVVDLGLGWTVTREIAAASDDDANPIIRLCRAAAALYVVLALAGGAIVLALALGLAHGFGADPAVAIAAVLIFAFGRLQVYTLAALHGLRRFDLAAALATAEILTSAGGTVALLTTGHGLVAVAWWQCLAAAAIALAGTADLARRAPVLGFRPSFEGLATLWGTRRFGLASQAIDLTLRAIWEAGPLLVGLIAGAAAVVPFHVGQKFPLALSALSARAAEVMLPAGAADAEDARLLAVAGTRINLALVLAPAVVLIAIAPELLAAWTGAADAAAVLALRLTAGAVILDALALSTLFLLWGRGGVGAAAAAPAAALAVLLVVGSGAAALIGPAWTALGLQLGLAIGAALLLRALAHVARSSAASIAIDMLRGFALPTLAAGAIAFAVPRATAITGWSMILLASLAGGLAFALLFAAMGARPEERAMIAAPMRRLRRWLRRCRPLRVHWHLAVELVERARYSAPRELQQTETLFEAGANPWHYDDPRHDGRFARACALIDRVRGDRPFPRVLELACAEGMFSPHLARRAAHLVCADASPTALARARARLAGTPNVEFVALDMLNDPLPVGFDLITADGVLDYFRSRRELARIRDKLVGALKPGGYLLLGNTRQHPVIERSWWAPLLARGGKWVNLFVADHPELSIVAVDIQGFYVYHLVSRAPST
jgi:O-antigen/teichoic acid export membrane protein